jgi:hypothetical protein
MTYDIPAHKAGDTWQGIPSITIFRNGSALDLTGATAKMQVRFKTDSPSVIDFSTQDNTITFLTSVSGLINIPPRLVDLPPATYIYDLKITLATGEVKTFLEGDWPITSHVTRL